MSTVYGLFDILALLYIFRSVQLVITIVRDWADIYAEPLSARKKSLAEQSAFFIAVPISVFIHEAAHAVAVWLAGGEVVEFGYRVFWGYVIPSGDFTAPQTWAIAVSGTLGSLLFGLLLWLATRQATSSSVRYFGLRAFRFQVFFSLVYYPIFTLFGFDGDWRTIYDFAATPLLSGITAVAHAGMLALFWYGDRQGWFEAPSHESAAEQARFEELQKEALAAPADVALQLRYIDALRRGGANRAAKQRLAALIKAHPQAALAHLEMAALQSSGKSQVSREAQESAAQALALGLETGAQQAYAYELIGRYQFGHDQLPEAVEAFDAALAALALPDDRGQNRTVDAQAIQLLLLRNQTYRRMHEYDRAYQDLGRALVLARRSGSQAATTQIDQELAILNKHAGIDYRFPSPTAREFSP